MILSQRDPRWSVHKIGSSSLSIGSYGCTTTCLAMVNNDFGENCTPAQVADHLDWYTPGGLVLWTKLALKKTSFVWRTYGFDQNDINKQVADPDKRVLLQVPLSHGSHWLKATHVLKGHLMADDPWFGDECDVLRRYGKITGSALFKRR